MRMAMETPETAVLVLRWGFQDPQGVSGDALANIFKETRCGHCGNPLVHFGPESKQCAVVTNMRKMIRGRDVIDEGIDNSNVIMYRGMAA